MEQSITKLDAVIEVLRRVTSGLTYFINRRGLSGYVLNDIHQKVVESIDGLCEVRLNLREEEGIKERVGALESDLKLARQSMDYYRQLAIAHMPPLESIPAAMEEVARGNYIAGIKAYRDATKKGEMVYGLKECKEMMDAYRSKHGLWSVA